MRRKAWILSLLLKFLPYICAIFLHTHRFIDKFPRRISYLLENAKASCASLKLEILRSGRKIMYKPWILFLEVTLIPERVGYFS